MPQLTLYTYLDQLQRAQEEQEELEKRLEQEQLEEELNLSREKSLNLELVPPQEQTTMIETRVDSTDAAQGRVSVSSHVQGDRSIRSHSSPSDIIAQVTEALPYIEITIWSYEQDDWRLSDRLQVDPSDLSPAERVARKYT